MKKKNRNRLATLPQFSFLPNNEFVGTKKQSRTHRKVDTLNDWFCFVSIQLRSGILTIVSLEKHKNTKKKKKTFE